jgi:hypothetical protein
VPYTKQTWVNGPSGGTKVNATRMSYIETGIETAQATAEAAAGTTVGASGTVPVSNGSTNVYTVLSSANVPIEALEDVTTAYTFVLADAGKTKRATSAVVDATTWTIPTNATAAFPIGTSIGIWVWGTGQITIVGASGVTLRSLGSATKSAGQYAYIVAIKVFTDTWGLAGDLTT